MPHRALAELFRQTLSGADIADPRKLLNMPAAKAAQRLPGFPYSILENLWHAVFWQAIWLDRLEGKATMRFTEDWQSPPASEFPALRQKFVANIERARKLTKAKTLKHKMKSDEAAVKTLVAMAIHDTYHLGQMNLIKRVMRQTK
jgi:uncharacterized damage-inducible protein DinB